MKLKIFMMPSLPEQVAYWGKQVDAGWKRGKRRGECDGHGAAAWLLAGMLEI